MLLESRICSLLFIEASLALLQYRCMDDALPTTPATSAVRSCSYRSVESKVRSLTDTLGHMDFNPGNVIGSPDGCVFLDWAEAYVGHPFFTFEYLREHLFRSHPVQNAWQSQVTSCYLEPWSAFGSMDEASRPLEITPLLAVFAYALSNNTWQDSNRLQNPKIAGYFRSLVRRMQREAQIWDERRQRCLC
jgi:hypothetical protein